MKDLIQNTRLPIRSLCFASGDLGYASAVGWTLAVGMLVISLAQLRLSGGVGKE